MTKLLVFVLVTTFIAPIYVSAETEESEDNIKTSIIDRCRTQMGHMGASVVKFCVDEDLAAYRAVVLYGPQHNAIIDRCRRQMLAIGEWTLVKFCADEDIAAERALEKY